MIEPLKDDLLIYQGSTYDKRWSWNADGQPVDISSAVIKAQVRPTARAPLLFLDMSSENGQIVIHDAAAGIFGIALSANQTSALNFSKAVYDLEVHWATGRVQRLIYGDVVLSIEVTR